MECSLCKKPTIKYCSRCQTKYYCSSSCQKKDYKNHKVECPPRSADILVKNAFEDLMPTNDAVLYEYGFSNCMKEQDKTMLLGLYIGLITIIGCSASQIHSWWENGELPINIKKAYDDGGFTSGYYRWFLKNEHLLQDLRKYEGEKSDKSIADKYLAMIKPYLSEQDQKVSLKSLSESKCKIVSLYLIILMGCIPNVEQDIWIDFGFCTCKVSQDRLGEEDEKRLGELYRELIVQRSCMIDEFDDAFMSGSVIDLLKRKCDDSSWLSENKIEVFGRKQFRPSVFSLKQYALSESVHLSLPVMADYGFKNCRTGDEINQLRQMYKKLIKTPQFDPWELHKACVSGKIFDYVRSILPNEVPKPYLLKNLYPLERFE
ncbi:hypothetical protein RclHR1_07420008 [Rhizophagus clarus]|uniref:MYND-type domain-containing protein n=1 Tax=Rhizophagus clarus TaxID=94130 RepID=A0A2Z6RX59_9GLOM|nr:hypothetical protein RclHR1_07420008 [Rhizophagus clarus]GES94926.1 hypothetical protein RCL_jg19144.t1 [Rhizophagus clarus]